MVSIKQLWTDLFVQHKISAKMIEIASKEDGEVFQMERYGQIRVFAKKASELGDNFMSDPYSMQIKLENGETYSSFVKVLPSIPMLREAVLSYGVYHREIGAYRDLLPALRQFQKDHGISGEEFCINAPEHFYVNWEDIVKDGADGSGTVVVLEDLKCRGFKMADKKVGCDYEHARLTLEGLANYHATSVAFIRHHKLGKNLNNFPPQFKFLTEKIGFQAEQMIQMAQGVSMLSVNILRASGLNDEADWVQNTLLPNVPQIVKFNEAFDECDSLPSFIHGDAWINNFMYLDEEERVKSACLVDWQGTRTGHPGSDIVYFLFNSTTHETREKHLDQLLGDYYRQFDKVLSLFDIHLEEEGLSFEKFRQEVEKRYVWGMFMAFMLLPNILDTTGAEKIKKMEAQGLSGSSGEEFLSETVKQMAQADMAQAFLQNKVMCQRVTELVVEVKKVVGDK